MSIFDFEEEIAQARANAISDRDRAAQRTSISQQRLPGAVRAAGWNFLYRDSRFDPAAHPAALVIGVAPWNATELGALGSLFEQFGVKNMEILVFDIDDCQSADDLASVLPGVKPPMQTPVVAEYRGGDAVLSAEGAAALDLLARLLE